MPVFDTKTIDHFTPPGLGNGGPIGEAPPVYLIRPASRLQRANWHRAIASLGARYPADELLIAELRAGIREGLDPAEQPRWLDVVDRWDAAAEEMREAGAAGDQGLDPVLLKNFNVLERDMRRNRPAYAELEADRAHWLDVAPYLAAQYFLVGWEGVDLEFRTDPLGKVPEALLDALAAVRSDAEVSAIGFRAMALMRPDADAEKNSESRPGSPAGRGTSKVAHKRSTARAGKSRAKSTT